MTSLASVFVEIGTEELPAGFLKTVQEALTQAIQTRLDAMSLAVKAITVEKTPRRLVIRLEGVPEQQAERIELIKGPPVAMAFQADGSPSKALEGFLRKNNTVLDSCTQEDMGGTAYVVYRKTQAGQAVRTLIGDLIAESVLSLEGPRFMRWANNSQLFPRPIRWLLGFWNNEPLHFTLHLGDDVLQSGTTTRGHRLLGEAKIDVQNPQDYMEKLESQGKVILSTQKRINLVVEQLNQKASELGGRAIIDADLLDEVANILEYPSVMVGRFDDAYLNIPKPVLITVMKAHQRYFPVENEAGDLMPYFLVASNGDARFATNIMAGNERVLVARFEDAKFFYEEDIKTPLESRLESLDGVTFQKGLGSLKAKTQRIQRLAYAFSEALGLTDEARRHIERAALLCKTDLVTSMVFELTELQGEIGRYYALQQGESPVVAESIQEHYLPRFQGDDLPESLEGMVLSLADKLDTLVALFSQSKTKMPSGSKDPLGLRRLVNGVLLAVLHFNLHINLKTWCEHSFHNLGDLAQESWEATWERIEGFMRQRLNSHLSEMGYTPDVINAIDASWVAWEDLPLFVAKVDALKIKRFDAPDLFYALYTPANRIDKIIGKHYNANAQLSDVQTALFEVEVETSLYQAVSQAVHQNSTLAIAELAPLVERFFEEVMVMSENEAVRQNRLTLLSALHSVYLKRYGRLSLLSVT